MTVGEEHDGALGEQNGAVLGEVDHGQPVWTVNYLADGDTASSLVDVTAAWS